MKTSLHFFKSQMIVFVSVLKFHNDPWFLSLFCLVMCFMVNIGTMGYFLLTIWCHN